MLKKFVVLCGLFLMGAATNPTHEVLVLASAATDMKRNLSSKGFEFQNLGPNAIYCCLQESSTCVVGTSRKILSGASWSAALPGTIPVYCLAATADQLTTAATVVTEAF